MTGGRDTPTKPASEVSGDVASSTESVSTAVTAQQQAKFGLITGVRAVACLMVVWAHTVDTSGWFYEYVFAPGKLGVVIFFFISGYLVIPSATRTGSVSYFLVNRALRLYPLYWISLAAALLIWTVGADALNPASAEPPLGRAELQPWEWVANLTMGQQLLGANLAMTPYWSLTVEFCLYAGVVAGLVYGRGILERRQSWIIGALGLTAIAAAALRWSIGVGVPVAVPLGLFCMFIGASLRRSSNVGQTVLKLAPVYLIVVLVACELAYSFDTGFEETPSRYISSYIAGGLVFAVVAMFARVEPGKVLTYLGERSYGIYLFHLPVAMVVGRFVGLGPARTVLVAAATVVVADVLYRAVELPAIRFGRRIAKR